MLRFHNNILFDSTQNVTNSSTASIVISGGLSILQDSLFSGNMSIGNNLITTNMKGVNITVNSLIISNLFTSSNLLITNITSSNLRFTNSTITSLRATSLTSNSLLSPNNTITNLSNTNTTTINLAFNNISNNDNIIFSNTIYADAFRSTSITTAVLTTTPTTILTLSSNPNFNINPIMGFITVVSSNQRQCMGFFSFYDTEWNTADTTANSANFPNIYTLQSNANLSLSMRTNTTGSTQWTTGTIQVTNSTAATIITNITYMYQ